MFPNNGLRYLKTIASSTFIVISLLVSSVLYAKQGELESTVILISLDGIHPAYLQRYSAPNINRLARNGVQAEYLQPIFPTKTFPNHYSLVTGLYAENHGLVDNSIYDTKTGRVFSMRNREEVESPMWWGGEPVWVTAEKQGVVAGTFFFPGSETPIQGKQATYWFNYDGSIANRERVDTVLEWLQKPQAERPRMITLYMSDVDSAGHRHGPSSSEVAQALAEVDAEIGYLTDQLHQRNMLHQVDIMITSDHGMARVDQTKHMIIDKKFDTNLTEHVVYSRELVSIYPKEGNKEPILKQLSSALEGKPARIYRKSEIPSRFNHQNHPRIAPILVMAELGWIFVRENQLASMQNADNYFHPRGSHGYDNEAEEMRTIFIGHGPSFKSKSTADPISMVDLYNVMTTILQLEPAANDGNPDVIPKLLKITD